MESICRYVAPSNFGLVDWHQRSCSADTEMLIGMLRFILMLRKVVACSANCGCQSILKLMENDEPVSQACGNAGWDLRPAISV